MKTYFLIHYPKNVFNYPENVFNFEQQTTGPTLKNVFSILYWLLLLSMSLLYGILFTDSLSAVQVHKVLRKTLVSVFLKILRTLFLKKIIHNIFRKTETSVFLKTLGTEFLLIDLDSTEETGEEFITTKIYHYERAKSKDVKTVKKKMKTSVVVGNGGMSHI